MAQIYKIANMAHYNSDEFFMQRCIELAKKGNGNVAPNPMVGAVVVHKGNIIGEGYHRKYGEAHAEVNAIQSVKDKSLLKESSIYVSLEPCAHFGKTPPCANLIVEHQIPNVIIGMQDPFGKVNGAGISILKKANCNVSVGVLEQQCKDLNKEFIINHTKNRPYVILKWAQTLDGLIDKERSETDAQEPNWITNEVCRSIVHKWRTETHAIMVGTNTALVDNPKLNVRTWSGANPVRVVLDRQLRLPNNLHLFDQTIPTLVFNGIKNESLNKLEYLKIDFSKQPIQQVLEILYARKYSTLFVEGGQELLKSFLASGLWDEARVFTGSIKFGKGIEAPKILEKPVIHEKLGDNLLSVYYNQ